MSTKTQNDEDAVAELVGYRGQGSLADAVAKAIAKAKSEGFDAGVDSAIAKVQEFSLSADTMVRCEKYAKSWHHAVASVCQVELPRELRKLK